MPFPDAGIESDRAEGAAATLFRAGRHAELAGWHDTGGPDGILVARSLALLDRLDEAERLLGRITREAPECAAAAAVERADVDLRRYAAADTVLAGLDALPDDSGGGTAHGRRLVVRATTLNRLGRGDEAATAALEAVDILTAAHALDERARALDLLGTILAWSGDLEQAGLRYALALADWAALGNATESAGTMAGLGRLNLEARRHAHALDFLERARDLAVHPASSRTGIRLRHNVAQALAGLGRFAEARDLLLAAADDARAGGIPYLEFICRRDAAVALAQAGDAAGVDASFARAAALITAQGANSYDAISLRVARAAAAAALDAPDAVAVLERAATDVAGLRLGAPEIDTLRLLATALARRGDVRGAERRLTAALRLAVGKGLSWHRRELRMDLARLRSPDGALVETDRPIHHAGTGDAADRIPEHGYLVRGRLGCGTFGEVFHAYDLDNAREVAIKRLSFTGRYDVDNAATIIASVERELEAAQRVEHPGVARVYGLTRSGDGEFHLVQEFIAGPSLRARMRVEPQPDPVVVARIAVRIAQALSAIHRAGVIHRDLKPENVILRNGSDPVIIDFGIAHVDRPGAAAAPGLGTRGYMPPEQAAGRRLDARCDIFALGAMVLEWLAALPDDAPSVAGLRAVGRSLAHSRKWRRPSSADAAAVLLRQAVE